MNLQGIRLGFALTGSHCTVDSALFQIEELVAAGAKVLPIVSQTVQVENTRFGQAREVLERLKKITGHYPISSIVEAENIGPGKLFDLLIVAPCTGNTLAKLANGITDTTVLMAIKAHLRNGLPVLLAIATNDGLGINARNIGILLNARSVFMVPFGQDNPVEKPNSLVARMELIIPAALEALQGKQLQPILMPCA